MTPRPKADERLRTAGHYSRNLAGQRRPLWARSLLALDVALK